jgi:hypothetical protein
MNKQIEKLKKWIHNFCKDPLFLKQWETPYSGRILHENQKSVWISAGNRRAAYHYDHDSYMFIQDMYTGIMPFMFYQGEREKYPVIVTPEVSPSVKRMIAESISGSEHTYAIEDGLCEFVRSTTHSLFIDNVIYYEINQTRNENADLEGFEFQLISPHSIFSIGNYYYQFVSWGDAKENQTRVRIVKIPKEKILKVEMPRDLTPTKRSYNRILKRLYMNSKNPLPAFQMKAMEQNKDTGFNTKTFAKNRYLEGAILTKNFGWDQRKHFKNTKYTTEHYSMIRFLRKKKVEAQIRTMLIDKLNQTFNSAPLNLGVSVEMKNLFTLEDVEIQERRLEKGGVKFIDIFNALKV